MDDVVILRGAARARNPLRPDVIGALDRATCAGVPVNPTIGPSKCLDEAVQDRGRVALRVDGHHGDFDVAARVAELAPQARQLCKRLRASIGAVREAEDQQDRPSALGGEAPGVAAVVGEREARCCRRIGARSRRRRRLREGASRTS